MLFHKILLLLVFYAVSSAFYDVKLKFAFNKDFYNYNVEIKNL